MPKGTCSLRREPTTQLGKSLALSNFQIGSIGANKLPGDHERFLAPCTHESDPTSPVLAMCDTGSRTQFISTKLARLWKIRPTRPTDNWSSFSGHQIQCFGETDITLNVEDSQGLWRSCTVPVVVGDFTGYDLLLGIQFGYATRPLFLWTRPLSFIWQAEEPATAPVLQLERITAAKAKRLLRSALLPNGPRVFMAYVEDILRWERNDVAHCVGSVRPSADIPERFRDRKLFSDAEANLLPEHRPHDHRIEVDSPPPFGPLYSLSAPELVILKEYLQDMLDRGWISPSSSPAGAPILFVPKPDGTLRLCVDYRGLNTATKKNRYPLPLIGEIIERVAGAKIFTKFDLRDAYHRIRIAEGDEWKTAFRTRYGHFEYNVMPFGLCNAPATFQAFINEVLKGLIDVCCVVYLDDILIYSLNEVDHAEDVERVMERLERHDLFAKPSKCAFGVTEVGFLGFIIRADGVAMEENRVTSISEWPTPKNHREIQVFLGTTNFYRKFIKGYSDIVAPITDLLRGSLDGKSYGPFVWRSQQDQAFARIKAEFGKAPLLRHFDIRWPRRMETDASGFGISVIMSQKFPAEKGRHEWHPVAFWSRKLKGPEVRWETHDQELCAIVDGFKEFRHWCVGGDEPVEVLSDHNNLRYFRTTKKLSPKQARWSEELSQYDFTITHRPGATNPADGASRRSDYEDGVDHASMMLPTLQRKLQFTGALSGVGRPVRATLTKLHMHCEELPSWVAAVTRSRTGSSMLPIVEDGEDPNDFDVEAPVENPEVREGDDHGSESEEEDGLDDVEADMEIEEGDSLLLPRAVAEKASTRDLVAGREADIPVNLMCLIKELQTQDSWVKRGEWKEYSTHDGTATHKPWSRKGDNILRFKGAAYVPRSNAIRAEILFKYHDDPLWGGHLGKRNTLYNMRRHFFWPTMVKDVREYCMTCDICQRSKPRRHKPYGTLLPLPIPNRPMKEFSMDFITGLPPVKYSGKVVDMIWVVVDRFTKYAFYFACNRKMGAEELASKWLQRFADYGPPTGIVSDRDSLFTSKFWTALCFYMRTKQRMSTAFHPQTDGQTERQNQSLEHFMRCFVNERMDDWAEWLFIAQSVYNRKLHSSTGTSPFEALHGYLPNDWQACEVEEPFGEVPKAKDRIAEILFMRDEITRVASDAQVWQKRQADKTRLDKHFKLGDMVLISAKNIKTKRVKKKFDFKWLGPFTIVGLVGTHAYRLQLPRQYPIHNVFHVSLLEHYYPRPGVTPPEPQEIGGALEWNVKEIVGAKGQGKNRKFKVRWEGWTPAHDSWEPTENLANAKDAVEKFVREAGEPAVLWLKLAEITAKKPQQTKKSRKTRQK